MIYEKISLYDDRPHITLTSYVSEISPELRNFKKGAVLVHQCVKCGARQRNRTADDDDGALLIKISAIPL